MKKLFLSIIFIFVFSNILFAQTNPLEQTREKYKPENWAGKTEPNKPGCPLGKVNVGGLEGGETEYKPGFPSYRTFKKENKNIIGVEVRVCNSAEEAHNKLLEFLAGLTTTATMPTLEEKGYEIGNVGFVSESNGNIVWIAFVRNNVLVVVSCLVENVEEVLAAAQAVDKAIKDQKDGEVAKPEIKNFDAKETSVKAGSNADLDFTIDSGTDDPAEVHFEISGEGQGYVEKNEHGGYRFVATGPGKVKITMTATNELCNSTTSEVEIEVTK